MKKFAVALFTLALCTLAVQNASAQSDIGLKGVGARIGLVDVEDLDSTFGFEVVADLGTFTPVVGWDARLSYWGYKEDLGGFGEASLRDVALTSHANYLFSTSNQQITPFVGGGLGMHFISAKVEIPAQDLGGGLIIPAQSYSDGSTELGIDIGGGLAFHASPQLDFVGEIWYGIINDVNQMSFKAGVTRWLGGSN